MYLWGAATTFSMREPAPHDVPTRKTRSMLLLLFPWLIAASLVVAPADVTTGELTLSRSNDAGNAFAEVCTGVLVAPDTVLLQASCFERNLTDGAVDLSRLHAAIVLRDPRNLEADETHTLSAVDLHPSFTPVDCNSADHAPLCEQARDFCRARLTGFLRMRCLARPQAAARSLLGGKNVNLALAYLRDTSALPSTALARHDDEARLRGHCMQVLQLDGSTRVQHVLSDTLLALRTPFLQDMWATPPQLVYTAAQGGVNAIVGLPSHFAELRLQPDAPLVYAYARVDTSEALGWMVAQLDAGASNGKRNDRTGLTVVDIPALEHVPRPIPPSPVPPEHPEQPDPTPTPEPGPPAEPAPQPLPEPEPSPEPPPAPQPPVSSEPSPTPQPLPDPVPGSNAETPAPNLPPDNPPGQGKVSPPNHARGGCGGASLQDLAALVLPPMLWRSRRRTIGRPPTAQ